MTRRNDEGHRRMASRMPESTERVTQASTSKATTGRCMLTSRSRVDRDNRDDRQIARRYDSRGRLKTNEFSNGYDVRFADSLPSCRPVPCTNALFARAFEPLPPFLARRKRMLERVHVHRGVRR
ncbi:hypothetical protein BDI4_340019 [Burkholderia diffusa]|nr:hypothetical protein BDI4_340019 [Burkholderia diffusa]